MRALRTTLWIAGAIGVGVLVGAGIALAVRARGQSVSPPAETAAAAPSPEELPRRPSGTVTLALVGDVLLYGSVESAIAKHGAQFPFAHVDERLRAADLAFCNLECPLTATNAPTPLKFRGKRLLYNEFLFRASPDTVGSLTSAGIDVVSLANNHMMDHGSAGLTETLTTLGKHGIRHCGGGANREAARKHALLEVRGTRIAFLAYCWAGTLPGTKHFEAGEGSAGVMFVHTKADGAPTAAAEHTLRRDALQEVPGVGVRGGAGGRGETGPGASRGASVGAELRRLASAPRSCWSEHILSPSVPTHEGCRSTPVCGMR